MQATHEMKKEEQISVLASMYCHTLMHLYTYSQLHLPLNVFQVAELLSVEHPHQQQSQVKQNYSVVSMVTLVVILIRVVSFTCFSLSLFRSFIFLVT